MPVLMFRSQKNNTFQDMYSKKFWDLELHLHVGFGFTSPSRPLCWTKGSKSKFVSSSVLCQKRFQSCDVLLLDLYSWYALIFTGNSFWVWNGNHSLNSLPKIWNVGSFTMESVLKWIFYLDLFCLFCLNI